MDVKNYDVIDPDFSQPDYLPPCDGGSCRPCPPMCPPPRPLPPCRPQKPGCTSNSTPWYGLPQWAAGDVTSWLMQMNGAMLRIDTIMHDLALRTGINGLPDDLVSCVAKLSQDMEVVKCTIGELSNKQANVDLLMQNLNTQFSAMKTDVASLTLSVTNLDTRIMTVDSKADGMKNDIVLLKTDLNMLSKTVQNLTANFTSFQNTVNESIAELESGVLANSNDVAKLHLTDFTKDLWAWMPEWISEPNKNGYPLHLENGTVEPANSQYLFADYGLYQFATFRTPTLIKFTMSADNIANPSHRTAMFRVTTPTDTTGLNISTTWERLTGMARFTKENKGWVPINIGVHVYFLDSKLVADIFVNGGDVSMPAGIVEGDTLINAMITTGPYCLTRNRVNETNHDGARTSMEHEPMWIEDWMRPITEGEY